MQVKVDVGVCTGSGVDVKLHYTLIWPGRV